MQQISTDEAEIEAISRKWLGLGVITLAIAGLFAIVLVVARTPSLSEIPFFKNLFHTALVVHVDLSVLVWFLCIAAMVWRYYGAPYTNETKQTRVTDKIAWKLMAFGALGMALAPWYSDTVALKSNYIPVLTNELFLYGLGAILLGAAIAALRMICFTRRPAQDDATIQAVCAWGARGAALIVLAAVVAFCYPFGRIPDVIDGEQYFELLFWAGGHILQFAYVQLAMIAWVVLIFKLYPTLKLPIKPLVAVFMTNTFIAVSGLLGLVLYDVESMVYRQFYTNHMIIGGGIAPIALLALLFFRRKVRGYLNSQTRYLRPAFYMSLLLFLYGGALGLHIGGQDVTIPAHYHGVIIAVTIALMGLAYALLPSLGISATPPYKLIFWQPIIYGGGQILHVSGLAWSGGYGVLRKTPGALEGGMTSAKVAMGIMGFGGLLAIIGGLLFVYVMARIMWLSAKQR